MKKEDTLTLEKRLERLKSEHHSLRQRLSDLRRENGRLRRSLIKKDGLLNSLPGGLVVISQGKIQEVNKRALDALGYTAEEVLGRDFLDLVHPRFKTDVRELHQRRVEGKAVPNQYETELVTQAGHGVRCDVIVQRILWEGRIAFLARLTGLEERKAREREIIRDGKRELVITMASGILRGLEVNVHEILACIRKAQSARGPEVSIPRKDFQQMSEAVRGLAGLAHTLDSLSREGYEAGRATLFDLRGVVQETMTQVEARLKEKASRGGAPINLKTYLRPVSPVQGDPEELREVVVGLIDNAVAAMPRGGDLFLSVEENAGNAYVYIQDSGTGIPEDMVYQVTDPFFTTMGKKARGLGLSLAAAVLKRHQGDLEVESKRGQGTTVTLRIPLEKRGAADRGRLTRQSRKNVRILILEEDHLIRGLFSQVLSGEGYRVLPADDIPSGLERLKAGAFDLAIVGSGSGDLQGVNLVRRIRRIAPETRLALISGQGGEEFAGLLPKERVDLLIQKPIDMTWVVNRIAESLTRGARK
ncbi:MAG: ATP-binding protein [Thermodesulfobacteriota bacterium]